MQKNKILLIDGHNLFIRCWSVIPTMNENGEHNGGVFGFLRSLKKLIYEQRPTRVIVCWEGKNSTYRRRKLYEGYKSNRGIPKRVNRAYTLETDEEQAQSLRVQLARTKEYLEYFSVYQIGVEFTEADDSIAYISRVLYPDEDKLIVSNDKDFLQLINESISVYRPATKEIVDTDLLLKKEEIHPKNWILLKCIRGDKSDSVPGVKGIGEKTLLKIFPVFKEDHEYSLEEIFSICKTEIEGESKYKNKYQSILDNRDVIERNYDLMELIDSNISLKSAETIRGQLEAQKPRFEPFKLRLMFMKDGARDQVEYFDYWTRVFMPLNYRE